MQFHKYKFCPGQGKSTGNNSENLILKRGLQYIEPIFI